MAQEERVAELSRTTKETDISLSLDIDGTGKTSIDTGVAFFDHMLDAFGRHGLFDLNVKAEGDIEVDAHHTVEDVGIVLGKAFAQAMGEKRGITRFASQYLPMDETLVLAAVDISGRGQLHWDVDVPLCLLGAFDTSLAKEFFIARRSVALCVKRLRSTRVLQASFPPPRALCRELGHSPRFPILLPERLKATDDCRC